MADFREYIGLDYSQEFLIHYGVGHDKGGHSGRYPWGSGDRPRQRGYGSSTNKDVVRRHKETARGYQKTLRRLENKRVQKKNFGKVDEAKELDRQIKDTISELESRGYTLNSKEIKRYIDHGEVAVGYILAGPVGAIVAQSLYSNKHTEDSKQYSVKTPEKARIDEAKAKEKKLLDEYYDASDKFEGMSKDNPKWESMRKEVEAKQKAANGAMIDRARVQYPNDSDEKIAKRLGFPVDEVRKNKR